MTDERKALIIPLLIITIGVGWLLTTLNVAPGIDWIWTLALAVVGLLTLAVGGWNKITVVIGPFFILASCMSLLRQTDRIRIETEIPILVIVIGILLFIAQSKAVPMPPWILSHRADDEKPNE